MKSEIEEQLQFLREELDGIEGQKKPNPGMSGTAHQVFSKIHKRWNNEDFSFKRPILELLFRGFVLQERDLIPRYRTPLELFRIK